MNFPSPGAVSGIREDSQWRALFSSFTHIVIVANSEDVRIEELQASYPDTALFVFFNKAYKVLKSQFSGHALLISRGQPRGANIVYRDEVSDVVRLFAPERFLGILNMRLSDTEKLNISDDYLGTATGHLDIAGYCADFYPAEKLPTSGFAIALWLAEQRIAAEIVLAGFSGKRSDKWRVVAIHDWTFEQVFLRLFAKLGKISIHGGSAKNSYQALLARFPEFQNEDISPVVAEVLGQRLGNTDAQIDKLISLTNFIRAIDNGLRNIKPRLFKKNRK